MDTHYVYLIACRGESKIYVKLGLTSSIQRRLSNIQTGCPHSITHAFVVRSAYREEVEGLEKLLHVLLEPECLRAEWYEGTKRFFRTLDAVLSRINDGGFTHEERLDMPDFVGPEFEIMLHRHEFQFLRLQLPIRKGRDPIDSAQNASPAEIADVLARELSTPLMRAGMLAVELQQ
ncbi:MULTISPECIES: GIY-YIG nuclease family protein [unclassified Burkholderia]|uniref:GIY-YIG nuclease family protein n=1 Tax=unclassified Burkholderia TaxID=2613784 RepID=UPI00142391EF|nr:MULTISPECIES: GIY-YIG nuclease family protein [unclassified Burkholderia]NIE56125.1 GIY-YIG nuclease family protein [Burkholderia sp. Ap-955]NIF09915.1 GIY-YIG nuclease family protein [Burkholderia sp. Ax-1735]NIG02991.1 GIY-YIG nuclease family protein [Burkholderia sp. Tr-849]